jgi:ElaA protein
MIRWEFLPYGDLTPEQLYEILALRQSVFVVEQRCAYQDADGRDAHSWHLLGTDETGRLAAYCRIVMPGHRFPGPSIGRVVIVPSFRGQGFGKVLMVEGIRLARELFPDQAIHISAQHYLQKFYEELGFSLVGEGNPFDEDGIPHVEMVYPARRTDSEKEKR